MKNVLERVRDLRREVIAERDRYTRGEQYIVDMSVGPNNQRILHAQSRLHGPIAVCLKVIGALHDILDDHHIDDPAEEGLYAKYLVIRRDGSSDEGEKHEKCDYFVIDWNHDKYAPVAARAYADACEIEKPDLANDLRRRASMAEAWK